MIPPRRLPVLALALLAAMPLVQSAFANPIAPTFFAATHSRLVDIYLDAHGAPETWSWFGVEECSPLQADSLDATAMDLAGTTGELVVCGARRGVTSNGPAVYSAMPWTCETRTPLVSDRAFLAGLEVVNGTTYGIGWADPPASATPSLWTLDPATGVVSEVGSLGALVADEIVSGLAWDENAHVLYTLTCCRGPLGEDPADFLARIDPASGQCTGRWRVLTATGAPMSYLQSVEWIGGDTFVAIERNVAHLYALTFVPETSPPGPGYWRATTITSSSPGAVDALVDLAWTGWDAPYPVKTTTWGTLKARYR